MSCELNHPGLLPLLSRGLVARAAWSFVLVCGEALRVRFDFMRTVSPAVVGRAVERRVGCRTTP